MESTPETNTCEPKPFQFSLRTLLIVVTVICVLLGLLIPPVRTAHFEGRRFRWRSRFDQMGFALQCYCDTRDRLPAVNGVDSIGKPINSWRFWLVPHFDTFNGTYDTSLPWDDPTNEKVESVFSSYFQDPNLGTPDSLETQMLAITGPGTAFEDGKTYKLEELPDDLIIIVETRNSGLHWMEPGDLDIRTMPRTINAPDGRGISSSIGRLFHVIFANGKAWQLKTDVPFEDVEKFLTIDGAKQHDRDEVLGPYQYNR